MDARLTVTETQFERKKGQAHPSLQGPHGSADTSSPVEPHAPIISPKVDGTPPATASYVTGSGALPGMAIHDSHTDLLSSTVHPPPTPLFTPQLPQGPSTFPRTALPRFTGQSVSPYPYQHRRPHRYLTSATALPSQPLLSLFFNSYHPLHPPFTSAENQAYGYTAPRSPFGTLGLLFSELKPVHTLVPSFARVADYRHYRLDNMSVQVSGSQGTRTDKKLKRFGDVATNFSMFDDSRSITLLKLLKDFRIGFNKAHVSEGTAVVMFACLVPKEVCRLYSFYVSADVRMNRTTGTFSWPGLKQTYLQRYLTDSVLTEVPKMVTQIRQQPKKRKRATETVSNIMPRSAARLVPTICSSTTTCKSCYQRQRIRSEKCCTV